MLSNYIQKHGKEAAVGEGNSAVQNLEHAPIAPILPTLVFIVLYLYTNIYIYTKSLKHIPVTLMSSE